MRSRVQSLLVVNSGSEIQRAKAWFCSRYSNCLFSSTQLLFLLVACVIHPVCLSLCLISFIQFVSHYASPWQTSHKFTWFTQSASHNGFTWFTFSQVYKSPSRILMGSDGTSSCQFTWATHSASYGFIQFTQNAYHYKFIWFTVVSINASCG